MKIITYTLIILGVLALNCMESYGSSPSYSLEKEWKKLSKDINELAKTAKDYAGCGVFRLSSMTLDEIKAEEKKKLRSSPDIKPKETTVSKYSVFDEEMYELIDDFLNDCLGKAIDAHKTFDLNHTFTKLLTLGAEKSQKITFYYIDVNMVYRSHFIIETPELRLTTSIEIPL